MLQCTHNVEAQSHKLWRWVLWYCGVMTHCECLKTFLAFVFSFTITFHDKNVWGQLWKQWPIKLYQTLLVFSDVTKCFPLLITYLQFAVSLVRWKSLSFPKKQCTSTDVLLNLLWQNWNPAHFLMISWKKSELGSLIFVFWFVGLGVSEC
jgi:hypothetical protein